MGLKAVDPRHKILKRPRNVHNSTTCVYRAMAHPYMYSVNVHANCACNELSALCNRHLVDQTDIPFNKKLWRSIARETKIFYPSDLLPVSYEDVYKNYTGKRKRAYHNAAVVLRTEGLRPKHWAVKMFVKPDRYPSYDCTTKDPRAIQYRSPEFNLAMGVYIKPFEEYIYPRLNYGVVSRTRVIAKGLNNYDRAELLLSKCEHFRNPCFVLLDHSRFDSTIGVQHLLTTHAKYHKAFKSGKLSWLCKKQLRNKGKSKHGIEYVTTGTRMSGDVDTACGNSVVNADCLYGFLTRSGITKFDFMLDGDDSVVIIEKEAKHRLDFTLFGQMGFKTKMEVVDNLADVEFCQSKIVMALRPVFVRKPTRAMSNITGARKRYGRRQWSGWIAGIGMCERAMNKGVPVLSRFGDSLASTDTPFIDPDDYWKWQLYDPKVDDDPGEITADARLTFAAAFGISPAIQLIMEAFNYTALVYKSVVRTRIITKNPRLMQDEQERLDKLTWTIWASTESAPERSGSSWWSCSETGDRFPRKSHW